VGKNEFVWECACKNSTGNGRESTEARAQAAMVRHWRMPTHTGKKQGTVRKK